MGTEVATRSRTEIAQGQAYDPFAQAANSMAGASAIYAKFNGNSGEMTYGAQAEEIETGSRMAASVATARKGWICWKDEEVVDEIMVPIVEGLPPRSDQLTDHGPYTKHEDGSQDGWSEQFAINFRLLDPEHDGVEITYKTTTKSAMRPLGDLLKAYAREYKNHPGCVPIVVLEKGSYMPKEKKHGKKYFPQFKIVDWIDEEELLASYGEDSQVEEGEENSNLIEAPAKTETKATKAETKTTKAQATKVEKTDPVETSEEEDDEEAELMRQLEAKRAAKAAKAAAAAEASATEEAAEEVEKPAPAAGRARRRNF